MKLASNLLRGASKLPGYSPVHSWCVAQHENWVPKFTRFQTSLNMPGFSLTLLLLPSGTDASKPTADAIISLLDDKPKTVGWKWTPSAQPLPLGEQLLKGKADDAQAGIVLQVKASNPDVFVSSIRNVANALISAEPEITRMDTIAGDGDAGLTLKVRLGAYSYPKWKALIHFGHYHYA